MAIKTKKNNTDNHAELKWPFGKKNYIVFAIAIVTIAIGFFTLSNGSETLAPILLVIGYLIIIPIALMIKDPDVTKANNTDTELSE